MCEDRLIANYTVVVRSAGVPDIHASSESLILVLVLGDPPCLLSLIEYVEETIKCKNILHLKYVTSICFHYHFALPSLLSYKLPTNIE